MPTVIRSRSPFALALLATSLLCGSNTPFSPSPLPAQESTGEFPKLEFRKWSGKLNVPDPVALSLDAQGRVFVTQTRRRKAQDLDIREHKQWIPDDLGLSTIEQKRAFYKHTLAIDGDQAIQKEHIADFNEDGVHDWRDLTVISEAIYRLTDTDRDGTADEMTIFAEDFQTEVTGVAAGVLAHDGYVYATVAPDLWKLRDSDDDGRADERESLVHGFGVHIALGGHDMHGLTVGPDGKIYWSIGDKGIHVERDGQTYSYPNQGGVMRCNPDGSDFEVFAHGLRNVQELAFDQYGNLFSVDNDSDNEGEKERFVYIVDGMDAGWRSNYQYRGDEYNPWMAERLWDKPGENHPAYLVPPLDHYIDGPAGFKFNPGTALAPEYQDFFFLTEAPKGSQYAFRIEYEGEGFKMVDQHRIGTGLAIVGLAFGPDGALYGADWDGGYPLDEKGSVIRIDVPASEMRDAEWMEKRAEVQRLLTADLAGRSRTELAGLLGHQDQRVRLRAQFALVEQEGGNALAGVALNESQTQLARIHALWGLGQLAREGDTLGRDVAGLLLGDKDARVRAQAVKTYGELPQVDGAAFLPLLADDDLHVRTLAGIALGRHPTPRALEALWKRTEELSPDQHYVRHGIVSALAACAEAEQLAQESSSPSEMTRLCAVLALRRQLSPEVARFLNDPSVWVATESARAIHDDQSIDAALPALAASLLERAEQTEPFTRRAINANLRVGDASAAHRLLQFAKDGERDTAMRLLALSTLAQWESPGVIDLVEGRRRDLDPVGREIDRQLLAGGLAELSSGSENEVRAQAVQTARQLGVELSLESLLELAGNEQTDAASRMAALDALVAALTSDDEQADTLDPKQVTNLLIDASQDGPPELQIHALERLVELAPDRALQRINRLIEEYHSTEVTQVAIRLLPSLPDHRGIEPLRRLGEKLQKEELQAELQLETAQALQAAELAREFSVSDDKFAYATHGGDPERGEKLFRTHVQAQCIRCHRIGEQGSEVGPPLTQIAKQRDTEHLLRSIVNPSADIEEKYRSRMWLLDSGEVVKGVVQSIGEKEAVVIDAEGQLRTFEIESIEETSEQKVSLMPEMKEILSAHEVRDLVAYLQTLK